MARASRVQLATAKIPFIFLILILAVSTVLAALSRRAAPVYAANCSQTAVGFTPLNDLGSGLYNGFAGGLYPNSSNSRPDAHETAGIALAQSIQPLDTNGQPDANGNILLLSIGMSNANQEFAAFETLANSDPDKNAAVFLVNGAIPGQTAQSISNPNANYWNLVDQRIEQFGFKPAQVQAVWLKQARGFPSEPFPEDAERLQMDLQSIVQILHDRFPNLKTVYMSSRIYAGYADNDLNPEPYAYQAGFAYKWLIEAQINGEAALNYDDANGPVAAPWLSWGPYLWADGLTPRSDGLIWECADLEDDGTHPSASGEAKVAQMLLDFFKTDATAAIWFLADGTPTLTVNHAAGAPGSNFTFNGTNFPANEMATVSVNQTTLGTVTAANDGSLAFQISTDTSSEIGTYQVTAVQGSSSASTSFLLEASGTTHPDTGITPIFVLPTSAAYTEFLYLPLLMAD